MTLDYRIPLLMFNILFDPNLKVGNCKIRPEMPESWQSAGRRQRLTLSLQMKGSKWGFGDAPKTPLKSPLSKGGRSSNALGR